MGVESVGIAIEKEERLKGQSSQDVGRDAQSHS